MGLSALIAAELTQIRKEAVISTSKILTEESKDLLRKIPLLSQSLFGGKVREIYKENFEQQQNSFIAQSAVPMKSKTQSLDFKIPNGAPPKMSKLTKRPPNPPKPPSRGGLEVAIKAQALEEGDRDSPPLEEPPEVNTDVSLPLPLPQSDLPVGARLGRFVGSWEKITENQCVLFVIKRGYRIPFISKLPLSPTPIFFRQSNISVLEEEVQLLLDKGAVECMKPEVPGFYFRIFLVLKKKRKLRLIIFLSRLHTFVDVQGFKMETQVKVRQAIQTNVWSFFLDLTDVYLHCPCTEHLGLPPKLHSASSIPIQSSSIRTNNKSLCIHAKSHAVIKKSRKFDISHGLMPWGVKLT